LAVTAVAMLSGVVTAGESENFDSAADAAAGGWVGSNHDTWGPFGYSDTNYTTGDPAGEAGGTFLRTNVRAYYADTDIGTINGADGFGALGELYVSAPFADNDTFVGHFGKPADGAVGYENHHAGFMLRESNTSNFRFMARIRGDGGTQYTGEQVVTPNGAYKFSYDYDAGTQALTATLVHPLTGVVVSTSTTSTQGPMTDTFTADAFGIGGGFNSAGSGQEMTAYIDWVSYSLSIPSNKRFRGTCSLSATSTTIPAIAGLLVAIAMPPRASKCGQRPSCARFLSRANSCNSSSAS